MNNLCVFDSGCRQKASKWTYWMLFVILHRKDCDIFTSTKGGQ